MKTPSQSLVLLALTAAASTLAAQTSTAKPATSSTTGAAVHHTATTATPSHAGGCVKPFDISPKIPAAPATASCPKTMVTLTLHSPQVTVDYISPLVDKETRDAFGLDTTTATLNYQELKVGTGELAQPNKFYTVQYTGWLTDGTQFDSSLTRAEPFIFPIGKHQVVPGWDLGLGGMHVGGKRRLFIPYQLAYGVGGKPTPAPGIPPKADLVFDIELLSQSDKGPEPKIPPAGAMKPGAPGAPGRPAAPANPGTPASPAAPSTPAAPPVPSTPAAPKQ